VKLTPSTRKFEDPIKRNRCFNQKQVKSIGKLQNFLIACFKHKLYFMENISSQTCENTGFSRSFGRHHRL